ncbi:FKBP-type peptidyl-prolyl cis-trans isomerase [bacterium]|nr:FKBP-type peptidyl-prolyl cis-trans isomerase [bacterium]
MTTAKMGDTVRVDYTGWFEDGEVFDTTADTGPLEFIMGDEEVFHGIENAIVGMSPGGKKTVTLDPDDAFGEYDKELIYEIDLDEFPEDFSAKVDDEIEIVINDDDFPAKVIEIKDETIVLDLNNPLAGQSFKFDIILTEIKA